LRGEKWWSGKVFVTSSISNVFLSKKSIKKNFIQHFLSSTEIFPFSPFFSSLIFVMPQKIVSFYCLNVNNMFFLFLFRVVRGKRQVMLFLQSYLYTPFFPKYVCLSLYSYRVYQIFKLPFGKNDLRIF